MSVEMHFSNIHSVLANNSDHSPNKSTIITLPASWRGRPPSLTDSYTDTPTHENAITAPNPKSILASIAVPASVPTDPFFGSLYNVTERYTNTPRISFEH